MKSSIIATGSYVPKHKVSNHDLAKIMDTNHDWIVQRTGIETRYFEEQSNAHMATEAAHKALQSVDKDSLDLIIVCTYTPDAFIPTTASVVKQNLNLKRDIPCFDLNAACTGFLYGIQVADGLLRSKIYQRILLIGSDMTSRTLDFTDRSTAILFGDGAGAVVLELGTSGVVETLLYAQDDHDAAITLSNIKENPNPLINGTSSKEGLFDMNGAEVFRFAIKSFTKSVKDILTKNNLVTDDLDFVISHQANVRIIETAARALKMNLNQFPMNLQNYGNTSAASIPMILDEMVRGNKLKSGMKIVLVAFGGGLTYGATLIEWQ